MIKNISLIGLGAIGALFGQKIQTAYPKHFQVLASADRINKYSQKGLSINGDTFDFNFEAFETTNHTADFLILAVKQYQLAEVLEEAKTVINNHTIIMSLLNGIESEGIIKTQFPNNTIIPALCIGQDSVRDNTDIRYTSSGKIIFGHENGDNATDTIKEIKAIFDNSKINYVVSDHIDYDLWQKFMINVSINQISAILDAPYRVFHQLNSAQELLRMIAQEVVDLSAHYGVHLKQDEIDNFIKIIGMLSPEGLTSMLQDTRAGRKTEYEMLSKTVVRLAEQVGIEVPLNKMIYLMMSTKEAMSNA